MHLSTTLQHFICAPIGPRGRDKVNARLRSSLWLNMSAQFADGAFKLYITAFILMSALQGCFFITVTVFFWQDIADSLIFFFASLMMFAFNCGCLWACPFWVIGASLCPSHTSFISLSFESVVCCFFACLSRSLSLHVTLTPIPGRNKLTFNPLFVVYPLYLTTIGFILCISASVCNHEVEKLKLNERYAEEYCRLKPVFIHVSCVCSYAVKFLGWYK